MRNASDAPESGQYGTYGPRQKTSVLLGYFGNGTKAMTLTIKDVTFAGPNNAPYDLTKKTGGVFALEGKNVGASGTLMVQTL